MDRQTIYSQELPRSFDFQQAEQSAMVAVTKLAEMVLGTGTFVDGLSCVPTGPASLNVVLNAGQIYSVASLEATTWSALIADTAHSIVKQGVALDSQTIAITPPVTGGFSQVYLIEVQYADLDKNSVVLPYFNAANPAVPLSGPAGAGTAQNTTRAGIVSVQLKAGTAAATGTQVAPSVDVGWTGLWNITVANGQATITSGNIVQVAGAPFITSTASSKLNAVPAATQAGGWTSATDTGTAGAYVVTLTPVPAALTALMVIRVKILNSNAGASTLNVNGLGAVSIVHADGGALIPGDLTAGQVAIMMYDGTNWQLPRASVSFVPAPQGRLTLVTGTPVMSVSSSGITSIFYTPDIGNVIPIYNGTSMVSTVFPELTVVLSDTTKSPAAIGASKVNDWFVWNDAGTIRIGHGPDWTNDTTRSAGTALVRVNGILLNNATITNGPAAQRGTYVGTTRSNGSSTLDYIYGGSAPGGVAAWFGVWNQYNRVNVTTAITDTQATWVYNSVTVRPSDNSTTNRISFVSGLAEESISVNFHQRVASDANGTLIGFALDATNVLDKQAISVSTTGTISIGYSYPPQLGFHFIQATEEAGAASNQNFAGGAYYSFNGALKM